jgi:4-amino-4-deoxy-L-arabinose transferase-like glycosyltransferase
VSRRTAILIVTAAAVLPRAVVMLAERDRLLAGLTEKSDRFASTLVKSGTFGFIPGRPSAFTQPLYALVLAPVYETVGRNWYTVAPLQILIAAGTAVLVFAIGERVVSRQVGVVAALLSTLHPYLVWHDVHINREIVDGFLAAAVTLLVVIATERNSARVAACAGAACGLAVLGNARLALLPAVIAMYLLWVLTPRRTAVAGGAAVVLVAALVVTPWVVRNKISVGCAALTTDSRALWKANNSSTYGVLARGEWIDQVPEPAGAPPWPELAADITARGGPVVEVDECAQMRFYRRLVIDFWRDHPGEKAKLAVQAVRMLWNPSVTVDESGTTSGVARTIKTFGEPVYWVLLVGLAFAGLLRLPRRFLALTLILLGYQTVTAMVFVGTVRYRVPWDFLICIPAAVGISIAVAWLERDRRKPSTG